jgi:hypothetical protein
MTKRRRIHGKKLLIVAGLQGASMMGCGDDSVANLIAPPPSDSSMDAMDSESAVANLVAPPPDADADAQTDAMEMDADEPTDAETDAMELDAMELDAPVANLIAPPDGGEDAGDAAEDA